MSRARERFVTVVASIGVVALAGFPLRAQSQTWEVSGNAGAEHLGGSLTYVPDVDSDGVVDILAGATNDGPFGGVGRAYLYSGATMTLLHEFDGDAAQDSFGAIVADLGDVDGDGTRDFAIAAPDRSVPGVPLGAIFIESGTGSVIRTITSASSTGQVGLDLSYLEDVDGDGVRDLLYNDFDGSNYTVLVVSGAAGATIRTHSSSAAGYGLTLNRTGDVDGDGVDDYAICDQDPLGGVNVYSGATGSLLFLVPGYYLIVRPAGDVDLDGHGDLMLSNQNGQVPVVSGATGLTLYTIRAGSSLGVGVSRTGDFDGDGHPDLVATHYSSGLPFDANIYSGLNGALLAKLETGMRGGEARALDATEDLDGDGVCDVLAGSHFTYPNGWDLPDQTPGGISLTSAATGSSIAKVFGIAFASEEGDGFTLLDDRDGDGFRDLAGLAPHGTDATGGNVVQILSGADGHELSRFTLAGTPGRNAIVRIGDVTGDGVEDLAIRTVASAWPTGIAEIRSGTDGSLFGTLQSPAGGVSGMASAIDPAGTPLLALTAGYFVYVFEPKTGTLVTSYPHGGSGVSCAGDVDQDGVLDWISYDAPTDVLHAFSGASAAALWTVTFASGSSVPDLFGTGDLDGDGIGDALVSFGGYVGGSVQALSGASGSQIFKITSNVKGFGTSVVPLGDVNRDGVVDIAVGAPDSNLDSGSILLYSGATQALLDRIDGDTPNLGLGNTLPKLPWGDDTRIDGDAIPDLVSGNPELNENRGRIWAFRLDDLFLQIVPSTAVAGQLVWLNTRGGPAGTPVGLFVVALDGAPVDTFVAFGTMDATGSWSIGGTVPSGLSGHVVTFRSYAIGFQGKVVDSQDETLTIQ